MSLITPDFGLLFWMVLIFGIVLFILAKFGFPAITNAVDSRSKRIDASLKKAAEAEVRLASIEQEHEKMLTQARKEHSELLRDASAAREAILQKAREDAAAQAAELVAQAHTRIEAERRSMEAEMRAQVAALSVQVAEKLLRTTLSSSAEQKALVERLLDESAGAQVQDNNS